MISDDIRLSRAHGARRSSRASRAGARDPGPEHHDLPLRAPRSARRERRDGVDEYLNQLNKSLLETSQAGGEVFVSNAVVRGSFVLRACIVNFHTDEADVVAVPEIVGRIGAELDRTMRPAELAAR